MASRQWIRALIATAPFLMAVVPAHSQVTTCKTPNCAAGSASGPILPAGCKTRTGPGAVPQDIAKPRIIEVKMQNFAFVPTMPRVEGQFSATQDWAYQCIEWHNITPNGGSPWHSSTEDTSGSTCNTSTLCTSTNAYPSPCDWETGNIDPTTTTGLFWGTCHYKDIPAASYPFECRLHGGLGMTGSLTVVSAINLQVKKGVPAGSVQLDWTGGSAAGPWEVTRDTNANMTAFTVIGSPTSKTFTDTPPAGNLFFYLVREKEPAM